MIAIPIRRVQCVLTPGLARESRSGWTADYTNRKDGVRETYKLNNRTAIFTATDAGCVERIDNALLGAKLRAGLEGGDVWKVRNPPGPLSGTLRIMEAFQGHNIKVEFENRVNTFVVRLGQLTPLFSEGGGGTAGVTARVAARVAAGCEYSSFVERRRNGKGAYAPRQNAYCGS